MVLIVLARVAEDVEARRNTAAEEVRLGERQLVVARVLAATARKTDRLAAAEEVALCNRAFDRETAGWATAGRVTTTDRQLTRRLLNDVDNQNDLVRLRTRSGRDVDALEEVQ